MIAPSEGPRFLYRVVAFNITPFYVEACPFRFCFEHLPLDLDPRFGIVTE